MFGTAFSARESQHVELQRFSRLRVTESSPGVTNGTHRRRRAWRGRNRHAFGAGVWGSIRTVPLPPGASRASVPAAPRSATTGRPSSGSLERRRNLPRRPRGHRVTERQAHLLLLWFIVHFNTSSLQYELQPHHLRDELSQHGSHRLHEPSVLFERRAPDSDRGSPASQGPWRRTDSHRLR